MTKYQMFLRWVFVAMMTIGLIGVMAVNALNPQKTLQGLDADEIAYVSIQTSEMTEAALVPEDRVGELLDILAAAELEKPVLAADGLSDSSTTYTFQKAGNVKITVKDMAPYLVVRGLAWEVDEDTSRALSAYYDSLVSGK